jgi:hypothetical protein
MSPQRSSSSLQKPGIQRSLRAQVIDNTDAIVSATDEALCVVAEPRFLRTERGYQGRFYCALQQALDKRGVLQNGYILEMEYQKSARHGMSQRPDIVLHLPAEDADAAVHENNLAVWALKRHATEAEASSDFEKLDEMFQMLRYPLGFFVNIDAKDDFAASYAGQFPKRLWTVSVSMENSKTVSRWGRPGRAK